MVVFFHWQFQSGVYFSTLSTLCFGIHLERKVFKSPILSHWDGIIPKTWVHECHHMAVTAILSEGVKACVTHTDSSFLLPPSIIAESTGKWSTNLSKIYNNKLSWFCALSFPEVDAFVLHL